MIAIDILSLVDRLEGLVRDAKRSPFSQKVAIDEQALANLIDQMRLSIPDQVQEAEALLRERDAVLARAQDEATRMLQEAKVKIEEERVRQAAEQEAEIIREEARDRALAFEDAARQYAIDTLHDLAQRLESVHAIVQNGLDELAPPSERKEMVQEVESS
ncbi:MAG: hypothetical protein ACOX2R_05420 [Anaerolineae bacterium]